MGSGRSANKRQMRAAEQAEAARRQQIQQATGQIDAVFDSPERAAQIEDYLGAMRGHYTADATKQRESADRNLQFAVARGGQTGGSVDADAREGLGNEFMRALLESERRAQGDAGNLRSQDMQTRLGLIDMAQSGADVTTGATRAAQAMRMNADPRGQMVSGLGDMFAGTGAVVQRKNEAGARRRAEKDFLYGRGGQ